MPGGAWMYNWAVLAENHLHQRMMSRSPTPTTPKVAAPDLRHACQPNPSQLDPRTQRPHSPDNCSTESHKPPASPGSQSWHKKAHHAATHRPPSLTKRSSPGLLFEPLKVMVHNPPPAKEKIFGVQGCRLRYPECQSEGHNRGAQKFKLFPRGTPEGRLQKKCDR